MLSLVLLFALLSAPVSGFFFAQSPRYQATLVRYISADSNTVSPLIGTLQFENNPANAAQIKVTYALEGIVVNANLQIAVKNRKTCNRMRNGAAPAAGAVANRFTTVADPWPAAGTVAGVANTPLNGQFFVTAGVDVTDLLGHEVWVSLGAANLACGLIGQSVDSIASESSRLPGVANAEWNNVATDFIRASQRTSSITTVDWSISGLRVNERYIARLHRGQVCPINAADINLSIDGVVGGGLFGGGLFGGLFGGGQQAGSISFTGTSSVAGTWVGSQNFQGTLQTVFNRVFVLSRIAANNVETRVGCLAMGRRYEMTDVQLFPGVAAGTVVPSGTVAFEQKSTGIYSVQYSLSGMPVNALTSLSINGGITCRGTAAQVGTLQNLYATSVNVLNPGGANPFGYTLTVNANGFTSGAFDVAFGFITPPTRATSANSASNMFELLGHTVVINSLGFQAPYTAGAYAKPAAVPLACGKVGNAFDTTSGTTAADMMVAYPGSVAPNLVPSTTVSVAQFTTVPETIKITADMPGTVVNFNAAVARFTVRHATSCAAPAAANLATLWQGVNGNAFTTPQYSGTPVANQFVPSNSHNGLNRLNARQRFTRTTWESMRGHAIVVEAGAPLTNRMCGILSTGTGNNNNNMLWLLWLLWGGF